MGRSDFVVISKWNMGPFNNDNALKSPSFSIEMQRRMHELRMNPRQLSLILHKDNGDEGFAYDHVRKIYNGQVFPGRETLKAICDHLGLDINLMRKKINADKGIFIGLAEAMTSEDSTLLRIKQYWDYLSDIDKQEVLSQVQHRAEMRTKGN